MSTLHSVFAQASNAYEGGQMAGSVVRWIVLAACGFVLVRRAVTGNYGQGFRKSPLGTAVGILVVAGLMIASVSYDFGESEADAAGRAQAMQQMRDGCVGGGGTPAWCDCYATEIRKVAMDTPAQFADFGRRLQAAGPTGAGVPELQQVAAACGTPPA